MDIHRITSFARPLDLSDRGNLLIILITSIMFLAATVYHYILAETIVIAFLNGIRAGLIIFMTWAISRELDPDHAFSAFVPVTFVLISILLFGVHPLLPMLWTLLILRTINRTTGIRAGLIDILIILSTGTVLIFNISWIYGILTGIGLLVDSRLSPPGRLSFTAGLFIVIISCFSLMLESISLPGFPFSDKLALIAVTILFLPVILSTSQVQSVGDRTGERLDPTRVRAAQAMALLIVLSLSPGDTGSWLYGMYFILAGIGIYRLFSGRFTTT
ncbi:hypothetical protein [Methanolobus halotolerans]|nr:hypothetical protein [Methanolobus halotolerans]